MKSELVDMVCWCSIQYAVPSILYNEFLTGRVAIYCPLGHAGVVRKEKSNDSKESSLLVENVKLKLALLEKDTINAELRSTKKRSWWTLEG